MLLVLNLPLVGLWVRLLAIPQPWLYAGILVFATMGTIAAKPSVAELGMLTAFGVLGYLMRRFDYPIAPVVVGLILGPVAEAQLRRALSHQPWRSHGAGGEPHLRHPAGGGAPRPHRPLRAEGPRTASRPTRTDLRREARSYIPLISLNEWI